jgi:hypothetical protein
VLRFDANVNGAARHGLSRDFCYLTSFTEILEEDEAPRAAICRTSNRGLSEIARLESPRPPPAHPARGDLPAFPHREKSKASSGVHDKAGRSTVINGNIDNPARQRSEKGTGQCERERERSTLRHHYYGFTAHLVVSSGRFGIPVRYGDFH